MLPDGDIPHRLRATGAASVAAGAVSLPVGALLGTHPLLVLIAVLVHRMVPATGADPHHWLGAQAAAGNRLQHGPR